MAHLVAALGVPHSPTFPSAVPRDDLTSETARLFAGLAQRLSQARVARARGRRALAEIRQWFASRLRTPASSEPLTKSAWLWGAPCRAARAAVP